MIETIPTKDEGKPYAYQEFPFYSYGPNEGEAGSFNSLAEIPTGWTVPGGGKKAGKAAPAPAPAAPVAPATKEASKVAETATDDGTPKVDEKGTPFDPALHTGTITKAGLWRMKVGVKRPEVLDL